MSATAVVDDFLRAWRAQDIDTTLATIADDVVYALHVSNDALPYGGETHGAEALRAVAYAILEEFDYLTYEPVVLGEDEGVVRVQVAFHYHHRRTGENLIGTKRLVFRVESGLIVRIDEYHDAGFVEAFMRLVRHREVHDEVVAPPVLPGGRIPAARRRLRQQRPTLRAKPKVRAD